MLPVLDEEQTDMCRLWSMAIQLLVKRQYERQVACEESSNTGSEAKG
jgi:hypothetical protein